MNYAIEILEHEAKLVRAALKGWKDETYPEAKKIREKRLNELEEAINVIQTGENFKKAVQEKMKDI